MNKNLRAFLQENGLRADATEADAWALYDQLTASGVEFPGIEPGQRSAAGKAPAATLTAAAPLVIPPDQAAIDTAVRSAVAAEGNRRSEITERLQIAGMTDHDNGQFARSLLDNPEVTLDRAAALIFAEMKKRSVAIGSGAHSSSYIVRDSRDKIRAAVTDGLLLRSGHRIEKPADGSREFRGRHLTEICRELMEAAGLNVRGLGSMELVGRALAAGNTTDFPSILGALVNKNLLAAYNEWPATWRPFVAVTSANDFKDIYAVKLSEAPDLQGMNENGEYKTASFSDAKETYRVISKGIKIAMSRQMIINDDLRAFTRIPQLFGASAKRMEADAVYSLITTNGNMADGVALFHATHNNLAGTNAALSSDAMSLARAAMRKQTGLNGETIDVQPAFLLVPVVKETAAEIILMSAGLPTTGFSSATYNPWQGKLTPIADPHLDANSLTAWYLLAHPNQVPAFEVAYLAGEEQPYVEEMVDFNSDALVTKVRHDFGAGAVDHVGAYKNAGA